MIRTTILTICFVTSCLVQVQAKAEFVIDVGHHVLEANMSDQLVHISMGVTDGTDPFIFGFNLRAHIQNQMGVTGPVPIFYRDPIAASDPDNPERNTTGIIYFDNQIGIEGIDKRHVDPLGINYAWEAPGKFGIHTYTSGVGPGTSGGLDDSFLAPNIIVADDSPIDSTANDYIVSLRVDTRGVEPGTFDLLLADINGLGSTFVSTGDTTNPVSVPISITNGTIQVSAVPEPSSIIYASLAITGFGIARYRRRNKLAKDSVSLSK